MQKVDRLGWAAGFSLKTYGVRIGIRVNNADWLDRIWQHLPSASELVASPIVDRMYSIVIGDKAPRGNVRRFNLVYSDHTRLARSTKVDEVLELLESDLRLFVAELAPRRVFVHAGVVSWKGKAIVIPGRSYSGKTTMVSELVKAGATYYSDEYAVFDARGRVHPFPKPLELRSSGEWKQTKTAVEKLGGQTGTKPISLGLVMVTQFKAGAKWRPRELSPGKAVLELLSHTVSARRHPEKALAALRHAVSEAKAIKGVRGEASELTRSVLARLEKNA